MPVESLWGIGDAPQIIWPTRPVAGILLAAFYLIVLAIVLLRSRDSLSALTPRRWGWLLALAVAGFLAGQLFPVQLRAANPLNFSGGPAGDGIWLFPLAFIPIMLAAVTLPPAAALLVGLATGTSIALWTTHQVDTLFYVALFGLVAGLLRRTSFSPRLSRFSHEPLLAAPAGQLLLLWLVACGAFAYTNNSQPVTTAAGWALAAMNAQALPLLVMSMVGGLAAWLYVRFFVADRPEPETDPPPGNLRRRFMNGYAVLALAAAVALLISIFAVSVFVSRQLVLAQMAQGAQTVVNLVLRGNVAEQTVLPILPLVAEGGTAFLVGPGNEILVHSHPTEPPPDWPPPAGTQKFGAAKPGGRVFLLTEDRPDMTLVYAEDNPFQPWTVVVTYPYQAVITAAAVTTLPLTGLLLLVLSGLGVYLFTTSRSLTAPLTDLLSAARRLAAGQLETPIATDGQDEVADLGSALDQVRSSMKAQLEELNLLLRTSQVISSSIDIRDGMPGVLAAALKGVQAAGARAVVVNPSGRYPLTFQDGELGADMARFDRRVAGLVQSRPVVALSTPNQVRQELGLTNQAELPMPALVAIALTSQNRFQGVLWVGYEQPRQPEEAEIELLRTLAGQATVMVDNARLYANAEGGRRRLAAVLASTSDAVIVTDQTERVLLINPAMEQAFNLKATEVLGRPVAGIIDEPALRAALLGEGAEHSSRAQNVEITTVDGHTLVAAASTIFSNDRQVLGRVAVLHDISDLKALDELKSDFVATVSHDLRNPLTFMRGYVDMLPMVGDINRAQQEYLDKILGGIRQMSAMVENLLGLARMESGLALVTEEIAVGKLLHKVAAELGDPARIQGLTLVVMADAGLPQVMADEALVHRAITNLVLNAIKYAPHSGRVFLRADCDQEELVISVRDSGHGIARPDQMRLFEKFYSLKNGEDGPRRGTGLGLAIVKSVAERHGGRVWCVSQVGQGSTFYFSLPLESPPNL